MECQELDRSQVRTFLASEHSTPARSKKGVFSGASIYPQSSIFPQQRKLMGSSAQNSSGVHWCRRRVRFNQVPEKVPEKVWEALVQSQVRFNRVEKKVQQGSREGSGEDLGGFGAEPGQVQQDLRPFNSRKLPALGFAACFRKICKNKTLRLLGIPPKLILDGFSIINHPFWGSPIDGNPQFHSKNLRPV